ncbi:MAG: non-canonical purine NTP pyrophosphatase, partial [Clostridia bacterium]|nr:non-canonical purine NTP pyrophosphatase [Clostridia bacterium]
MNFFVATQNLKKLEELKRILSPLGIDPLCERDFDRDFPEVPEDGATFEENALIKARAGMLETGLPTIADDSGLCV